MGIGASEYLETHRFTSEATYSQSSTRDICTFAYELRFLYKSLHQRLRRELYRFFHVRIIAICRRVVILYPSLS